MTDAGSFMSPKLDGGPICVQFLIGTNQIKHLI